MNTLHWIESTHDVQYYEDENEWLGCTMLRRSEVILSKGGEVWFEPSLDDAILPITSSRMGPTQTQNFASVLSARHFLHDLISFLHCPSHSI